MSIIKEKEVKKRIKAKGVLEEITDDGFIILDEKEETKDVLGFDDIEMFIGKSVSFTIVESEKEEMADW